MFIEKRMRFCMRIALRVPLRKGKCKMNEKKTKRGGKRPGAGRPRTGRRNVVAVRLSDEALRKLERFENRSRYIENLIMGDE